MRPTPGQRCDDEQQKLSTSISRNLQWNLHKRATDVQTTCKVLHRHANVLVAHPRVGRNTTYVDGKYRVAYVTPLAPSLSLTVPVTRKNRKSKQDSRNAGKPMTYLSSGIDSSMTTKNSTNKQLAVWMLICRYHHHWREKDSTRKDSSVLLHAMIKVKILNITLLAGVGWHHQCLCSPFHNRSRMHNCQQ